MIRVLVVDDQALVRQGLRLILELAGFEVAEAGDGAAAVAAVDEQRPDVVLMDLRMPVLDGVEATRRIVAGGDGGTGSSRLPRSTPTSTSSAPCGPGRSVSCSRT